MKARVYQPSQAGAGIIRASEIAITINATSIWKPALQRAASSAASHAHAQAHSGTTAEQAHTSPPMSKPQTYVGWPRSAECGRVSHPCVRDADWRSLTARQQTSSGHTCLDSQDVHSALQGSRTELMDP